MSVYYHKARQWSDVTVNYHKSRFLRNPQPSWKKWLRYPSPTVMFKFVDVHRERSLLCSLPARAQNSVSAIPSCRACGGFSLCSNTQTHTLLSSLSIVCRQRWLHVIHRSLNYIAFNTDKVVAIDIQFYLYSVKSQQQLPQGSSYCKLKNPQ